jgi:Chaperone of endosialidase/Secretion system C-terminal sorting domain
MKQISYNKVRRTAIFASALAMFVISQKVDAQNWVNNGNSFIGAGTLGTNNAQNVFFETNNVQRMTLVGLPGANQGFFGLNTPAPTSRLQVRAGQISQVELGVFGSFLTGNDWIGMGLAGTAAVPIPNVYGIAMTRGASAGYFNLIDNTSGARDVVLAFGYDASINTPTRPRQKFYLRSILTDYTNTNIPTFQKDIMIADWRGYVGFNIDPGSAAFVVDASPTALPNASIRAISVLTNGSFATAATASFASIGELESSVCPTTGVIGFRSQNGAAGVNVQVNSNSANLSWQDLTYAGNVNATTGAEARFSFNFRNNQPGPCIAGNNREVMAILANGRVGINTPTPVPNGLCNVAPAPPFNIDLYLDVQGGVRAEGYWAFSDQRFKSNIKTIENPMARIMKMRGTSYTFRGPSAQEGSTGGTQLGFIAQELQQVVPEAVIEGTDGVFAVNYNALTPLVIEGMKQQQGNIDVQTKQITEQQQRIEKLEAEIAALKAQTSPAGAFENGLPVNPALGNLQQNVPNPFNQQTVINFNVAQNAGVAMITIYDLNGRQIRSEQINQRGAGQLVINANELAPGMYIYALIVDGKAADSKRMIVTE